MPSSASCGNISSGVLGMRGPGFAGTGVPTSAIGASPDDFASSIGASLDDFASSAGFVSSAAFGCRLSNCVDAERSNRCAKADRSLAGAERRGGSGALSSSRAFFMMKFSRASNEQGAGGTNSGTSAGPAACASSMGASADGFDSSAPPWGGSHRRESPKWLFLIAYLGYGSWPHGGRSVLQRCNSTLERFDSPHQ